MNCLTIAIYLWVTNKCKGKIVLIKGARNPFPHFAYRCRHKTYHYKSDNEDLRWWKQFHFSGSIEVIADCGNDRN